MTVTWARFVDFVTKYSWPIPASLRISVYEFPVLCGGDYRGSFKALDDMDIGIDIC